MTTLIESRATTLAALLRAPAARSPQHPAVVGAGRACTHGELAERSDRLAAGLVALGLQPGDRVAYLGHNATEYWELFAGTQKAGLVVVPLNFRLAADEVAWILADAEVSAVLVEAELAPLLPADLAVPALVFDGPAGDRTGYEAWLAEQPATDPHRDRDGDALAALMYSSGTTGRPKGVQITVAGLLAAVDAFGALIDVDADSVSLVPTPYYHIAAGGWSLITLAAGGTLVQFREPTPAAMLEAITAHRATHAAMVPVIIGILCADPAAARADFSSLRHVVYGASPISETLMRRAQELFGAQLSQSYGLTETLGVTTLLPPADHVPDPATVHRLRSAGRAVPGVEVGVVDVAGVPLQAGEVGEVVVRGPVVTTGYWRNPAATAEAFLPGGWLRTGDVGELDADGYLYLRDRIKDVIVSGGENVYPAEVENALAAHPGVAEVAVVGEPSDRWGESPVAFVVAVPGAQLDPDDLLAGCRERLAHYKCPRRVEVVGALPRNPSGKVLRRELRAPLWAGHDRGIA
ncbi:long-chain-fatty-acid--CoA ligase [Klenkia sp. PcliD-1-E]|uniref:long-chain-fatty-acid--CoA ligase n=1 Tax=Klenkia sp. PcliD-1-E TaxID=2954492 RepID=UPI002097C9DC|nr:long-chain-fatty-acid--CoA ligase [Klenkia sp. PcliD-1-E]MCO7220128.1 long-chain-fatty-acid--CoA ligase [Klenkia sp. PcliD-1-E]